MSKLIQSHPKILGVCFLLTINSQMHQQFNTLVDLITQPMTEKANCSSLAGSSERTRPLSLTISIRFWQKTERKRRPAWIHFPCNTSNPSHPFNPTTPYFDTLLGHAGNPCAHSRFHFSFPFLNFTKTLSPLSQYLWALSVILPNAPLSQPWLRLHHSLNIHACSLPLPQPHRHRFLHTQLRPINKNKEKTAAHHQRSQSPNTRTLFRPISERERVRVGVWRESGV